MFTFSFFVGLTHFFRLKASLPEKCQKVRIYWVPFSLFPTQLRWEETQSPKRGSVEVFDEKFSGFNSLLFDFWYHHPIIINVCPPKRYLSFFPQIILPCCFLSIDFPLFYFLLFGKTNHSLFASDLGCLTPCPRDQQIKCFVDPCMFNYCSPSERCNPCNCKWCYPVCVPAYKGLAPGG